MDPFSLAVGAVGIVDAAGKLAQSCLRLYRFWESLHETPAAVKVILHDLALLKQILDDIGETQPLAPSVQLALRICQEKVEALEDIIKGFDVGYLASVAKRRDLLTKFRLREKTKEMQRFAMGLGDLKSTLSLALMQQR